MFSKFELDLLKGKRNFLYLSLKTKREKNE